MKKHPQHEEATSLAWRAFGAGVLVAISLVLLVQDFLGQEAYKAYLDYPPLVAMALHVRPWCLPLPRLS